jgi:hypothetical protein
MTLLIPAAELNYIADQAAARITHLSLHTASPSTTGANEATGGSPAYARKSVTFNAAGAIGPLGGTLQPATGCGVVVAGDVRRSRGHLLALGRLVRFDRWHVPSGQHAVFVAGSRQPGDDRPLHRGRPSRGGVMPTTTGEAPFTLTSSSRTSTGGVPVTTGTGPFTVTSSSGASTLTVTPGAWAADVSQAATIIIDSVPAVGRLLPALASPPPG